VQQTQTAECPFYRGPEHSSFMSQKARITRNIQWQRLLAGAR